MRSLKHALIQRNGFYTFPLEQISPALSPKSSLPKAKKRQSLYLSSDIWGTHGSHYYCYCSRMSSGFMVTSSRQGVYNIKQDLCGAVSSFLKHFASLCRSVQFFK
ncbi:hypothetical protein NPIL_204461 [Nephila pilipes]|uniref:Uncharacterized protein n=1 Tax=Nephila pilipes TaxID=299642 RepID=A0A8X6PCP4_NEPPI|nr:hypothetical protein NPIL_204461 [Nephila pilipes]